MVKVNEIYVFDYDDTLADTDHRKHLAEQGLWDKFFLLCYKDRPITPTIKIFNTLVSNKKDVRVWSGRGEIARSLSIQWIRDYTAMHTFNTVNRSLKLRPTKDFRSGALLKELWVKELPADTRIVEAYDDDPEAVEMYKSYGINSILVKV